MEKDLRRYLIKNYTHLFTWEEKKIYASFIKRSKLANYSEEQLEVVKKHRPKLLEDKDNLIAREDFFQRLAKRLLNDKRVFINRCPICGTLARTPFAKQGPCGHQWKNKNPELIKDQNTS